MIKSLQKFKKDIIITLENVEANIIKLNIYFHYRQIDPLANEAKELDRLFSTVNSPSEDRIIEIQQLYPLRWNVDDHCLNVGEFINEMMERIKKATAAIDSCLKEIQKPV
jgi:hypothetical protein